VDHRSEDGTTKIAREFNAVILSESKGLGYARQLCLDVTDSDYIVFVDCDVEIVRDDFVEIATHVLENDCYGATVGMGLGHRFSYGLPAGLLVLRKRDFTGDVVPEYVDARETYFLQKRLRERGLKTFYVRDSMIHRSQFRKFKPEWEGANTRLLPDSAAWQLIVALETIILLSLNSRSLKNIAYVPIFYLKFLRGFVDPARWARLNRGPGGVR